MDESIPVEYDEKFESEFKEKSDAVSSIIGKGTFILGEILVSLIFVVWLYKTQAWKNSVVIFCVITGVMIHIIMWSLGKWKYSDHL